jgi:hypothetical protein
LSKFLLLTWKFSPVIYCGSSFFPQYFHDSTLKHFFLISFPIYYLKSIPTTFTEVRVEIFYEEIPHQNYAKAAECVVLQLFFELLSGYVTGKVQENHRKLTII